MASYPVEPMYDAYGKPLGPSEYPHAGYPVAPQYPGMPPQYPVLQPALYPPHPMDPAYSQGKICITFFRAGQFKLCCRKGCKIFWSLSYVHISLTFNVICSLSLKKHLHINEHNHWPEGNDFYFLKFPVVWCDHPSCSSVQFAIKFNDVIRS